MCQNSFLVLTLASGLITAIPQIVSNPVSIPGTLAERLPLASTFFLTFTMQKAAASAGSLLQIVQIVIYFVKLIIQGGTPRSVYKQKYTMRRPEWGETFPNSTIIAIICESGSIDSFLYPGMASHSRSMLDSDLVHDHLPHHQWFRRGGICIGLCYLQVPLHLGGKHRSICLNPHQAREY